MEDRQEEEEAAGETISGKMFKSAVHSRGYVLNSVPCSKPECLGNVEEFNNLF